VPTNKLAIGIEELEREAGVLRSQVLDANPRALVAEGVAATEEDDREEHSRDKEREPPGVDVTEGRCARVRHHT
jgi:hypothetical protein